MFVRMFVYIIFSSLFTEQEGVVLHRSNPNKSLLSACEFMYRIRQGRTDDDPKFHDHATFLTRYVYYCL